FHPSWRARAKGFTLPTVKVNNFYQGVRIPPETSEVTLEFKPFVRWMWLPQFLFLGAGGAWLLYIAFGKPFGLK
ncbi:MAG: hypothetical protein ACREH5_01065, partial [Candidatus Omnitrophota bacterium]